MGLAARREARAEGTEDLRQLRGLPGDVAVTLADRVSWRGRISDDVDPLVRIKRLLLAGRYAFSLKAELEMFAGDIASRDVLEAVINAPAITKVLRSRSHRRSARREKLYVIVGSTYDGVLIYTKGAVRKVAGEDTFYFLVSSKRWAIDAQSEDED